MRTRHLLPAAALLGVIAGPRPALAVDTVFVDVDTAVELVDSGAAVIDARGAKDWSQGHIPGAQPLSWTRLRDGLLKVGRLTDDMGKLQATFRGLGVDDAEPVLVYDAGRGGWGEAGRIWWTLRYLGHGQVHILDGGLPVWQAAGRPTDAESTPAVPGDFTPRPDETKRARKSEVERYLGQADVVFWDTREPREYAGETPYGEARGGHVPGAVGLYYQDLLDDQGRLLDRDRLKARLVDAGIAPGHHVVPYCTGGVRSGFAAAVLEELGYERVENYDGSMWEWAADKALPLE
ncbi:MAG: sulfurtransferase [Alphaproteobacteria bacterium]|nr:sulfurtransferase [Alphaproteobacteria bacterium]